MVHCPGECTTDRTPLPLSKACRCDQRNRRLIRWRSRLPGLVNAKPGCKVSRTNGTALESATFPALSVACARIWYGPSWTLSGRFIWYGLVVSGLPTADHVAPASWLIWNCTLATPDPPVSDAFASTMRSRDNLVRGWRSDRHGRHNRVNQEGDWWTGGSLVPDAIRCHGACLSRTIRRVGVGGLILVWGGR